VKCKTHEAACGLFSAAMGCGFRESGIGSNDIVATRISMRQDIPIGYLKDGEVVPIVSDEYIKIIDEISLDLFNKNERKISELSSAIAQLFADMNKRSEPVETKEQRRERKRAEGLKRQQELLKEQ
jgi:tRNA wybutosine-synthesizing protein 3